MKINLGSGASPLAGFVNVDALPDAPGVDVVADISQPLPFADASADVVYASHVLEHFPHAQTAELLSEWRRVLRPGGQLLIAVPDLDVIARISVERRGWFTPPHGPWIGAIYGGQKDEYDFHKAGFTAPWLAYLLSKAGFGEVKRVERFHGLERSDNSQSPTPFGQNLSLNMVAVAGAPGLPLKLVEPEPVERVFNAVDRGLEHAMNISTSLRARIIGRRRRRLERALDG